MTSNSPVGNAFGHPKGACPRGVADCTGCNPNSGPAAEADVAGLGLHETPAAARNTAFTRALAMRNRADRLFDLASLTEMAADARRQYGEEAAFISVESTRDTETYGPDYSTIEVYSAQGEPIGTLMGDDLSGQPLPNHLFAERADRADLLDIAQVEAIDLNAAVDAEEQAVTSEHIARTAIDSFIVDRGYAIDIAEDHIEQGWDFRGQTIEGLTDEEREKVADWFENQWGGFGDAFYDRWHGDVDQALQDVLRDTRGGKPAVDPDRAAQAKGFRSNEHMLNEAWGV